MDARRSTLGVAVLDGNIVAVGGNDGSSGLGSAEMLDPRQANRWRMGEPLLEVRSDAGVRVYRDRIVAAGGHDGPLVRASLEIFGDEGWLHLPEMSLCRRNAGIVVSNVGTDLLLEATMNLSTVECLSLESPDPDWSSSQTEMPQARSYCGVTLLPKA